MKKGEKNTNPNWFAAMVKHGCSGKNKTPEYRSWACAKDRCYNKKATGYNNYGGRGIKVCDRWLHSFENFLEDMGLKPTPKHSLDRIDVNGNYELSNCRWATQFTQSRNRKGTVLFTYNGESLCVSDWANKIGMNEQTLEKRLRIMKWSVEKALTTPISVKHAANSHKSKQYQDKINSNGRITTSDRKGNNINDGL
jgi:ubiquitin